MRDRRRGGEPDDAATAFRLSLVALMKATMNIRGILSQTNKLVWLS